MTMAAVRRVLTTATCLLLPTGAKPCILNALGHTVHSQARVGFSLVLGTRLVLAAKARIGGFNLIKCNRLVMRSGAYVNHLNWLTGPFSCRLMETAAIGNLNRLVRGPRPGPPRPSHLALGRLTKITSGHRIDCTDSVIWGDYGTLAGSGSQIWTHGFVHARQGPDRAIVCGRVRIGNNVYIGSHSVIAGGIRICDGVAVGAHASVAVDLNEPGVYVPNGLRYVPRSAEDRLMGLDAHASSGGNDFYWKSSGGELRDGAAGGLSNGKAGD